MRLDRPERERETSKLEMDKGKAEEQSGMDICHQEELHRHLDRVQTSKDGMNQACSLMFSTCCSKLMQGGLEALPEFEQSIRNNPIELLKAIKQNLCKHSMCACLHVCMQLALQCCAMEHAVSKLALLKAHP